MSLFRDPEQHAANPPETWTAAKAAERCWQLRTAGGVVLETFKTRKAAEAARTDGFAARLYAQEARWYAGERVGNWRPWADIAAERERRARRQAELVSAAPQ